MLSARASTLVGGLSLLASISALAQTALRPDAVTVIRAGTLIDGRSATPRRNQVIVVRGNRIDAVGDAASTKVPAGAAEIDLSGRTVLPGLI